ncbi:MAG: FAD-dependent oxidoreductase [Acidobacteriota bacterium]|nr:FAD-binding dehydrogenase [Acidobacteriota bacterium]MEC7768412.1 FAD-dependent oxidoreductase [Acidobacteriota bacterium]
MATPERETDVVVAGAGAAGLAAAIKAADGGATVALLEASSTFRHGSNTSMSTSMIPVGGSRWQEEIGIDSDSPDVLYQDIMIKTKGSADPVVTRALVDVGRDLSEFLASDCEVPLELLTDAVFPGHTHKRHLCVHDRAGRTLHRHLLEAAEKRGNITMVMPLRLLDLVEIEDGWEARAESPDGTKQEIIAGSVVLATNGFGANAERVAQHIPEVVDGLYFGGDHSLGDALDIGERLGADVGFLDAYQGHGSVATPHGVLITWTAMMNGAFLVNAHGKRFGDETTGYSEFAVQVIAQPEAAAWMIYDQAVHEKALPFADYQQMVESDGIRWSDDVAGLASLIGCEEMAISATLKGIADFTSGTAVDPLGRTLWPHDLNAPFTAIKVTGALFHTQGGLRVNENANVLRGGKTIPGLYAAGGAAAGISGNGASGYLSGNGLLAALGLGYLAGRAITRG